MPKVIILGSSNAVPDEQHENTHLAIVGDEQVVLIDCVGNPIVRLKQAGIELKRVTDLILTHFHPDHVSGVPLLLMDMWLLGRSKPLAIHGLEHTLSRLQRLMHDFDWESWPNFFNVDFRIIPETRLAKILESDELNIWGSPVQHMVPTIGLRVEAVYTGKVMAYSSDTEPCDAVVELASKADILIHEASGPSFGHSSAAQAGEIASRAKAKALQLIHYSTIPAWHSRLIQEAQQNYQGVTELAIDFLEIDL